MLAEQLGRLLAAAGIATTSIVLVSAGASALPDSPPPSRSEHQRIVEFWTPERVAKAQPRDFVYDPAVCGFVPARPGNGNGGGGGGGKPGGGGTSTTVLGAPWNGRGAILESSGKVFFALGDDYYVCSAAVVEDGHRERNGAGNGTSIILTAAHCTYDEVGGAYATNWMFIPEYDTAPAALDRAGTFCAATTHGCWTATSLHAPEGYRTAEGSTSRPWSTTSPSPWSARAACRVRPNSTSWCTRTPSASPP
jgi:hypothetical protein